MRIDLVSVFPEFFDCLKLSIVGKARQRKLLDLQVHDLRDWAIDSHRTVDDTPAGGGAGMVMKPDIWGNALDEILSPQAILAIPTPGGVPIKQVHCESLSKAEHLVIACGRYEGIDTRVAQHYGSMGFRVFEFSLGDYVLNGGEVAAIALVEAVSRLIPGMVGNPQSLLEESHGEDRLLEYPIYTRPTNWRNLDIPPILQSGNHRLIHRWRRDRALEKTISNRPDLLSTVPVPNLDKKDIQLLAKSGWFVDPEKNKLSVVVVVAREIEYGIEYIIKFPGQEVLGRCLLREVSKTSKDLASDKSNDTNLAIPGASEVLTNLDTAKTPDGLVNYCDSLDYTDTFLTVTFQPKSALNADQKNIFQIVDFYISSQWYGTGIAQYFLSKSIEILEIHANNPCELWAQIPERNRRALRFFKGAGFTTRY